MKYCWSCGSQIEDDSAFCPQCGISQDKGPKAHPRAGGLADGPAAGPAAERAGSAARPTAQHAGTHAVKPTPNKPEKRMSRGAIAGIVAAIVALLLLAALGFAMCSNRDSEVQQPEQSATDAKPEASTTEAKPEASTSAPAEDKKEAPAEQAERAAQPPASVIDLADPTQYYDTNIFLSNFAEVWRFDNGYDRANYQLANVLQWVFDHHIANNTDVLEKGKWTIEGTMSGTEDVPEGIGGPGPVFYRRIATSNVNETLERYLGLSVDLGGIDVTLSPESSNKPGYVERDGYLYEGLYRGASSVSDNVVICTGSEGVDDTHARVTFNVYRCSPNAAVHEDASWYGYTTTQIEEAIAGTGGELNWTGEAVIEVRAGEEHPYKLVSMTKSGTAPVPSTPAPAEEPANDPAAGQLPANPSSLAANDSQTVELAGTVVREEQTTAQTGMGWAAVVYWLVLDAPVFVEHTSANGTVSGNMDRITLEQLESYAVEEDTDVNAALPTLRSSYWDGYEGQRVLVRGTLVNTGNAHTLGLCKFSNAEVV